LAAKALFVVLFGIAVLMAQVAPSRVTDGIYQVIIGDGAAVIPTESLTCARTGDTATCTTPVGGHRLTIDIRYTGAVEPNPCTARHGDRPVSCEPSMGFTGHASHTVWITDDLGLSRAQLADLNAAAPWWRLGSELYTAALALIGTLAAAAGVLTFLLRRRARPVPPDRRLRLVAATTVLAMGLFIVTGGVFRHSLFLLSPLSLLAGAMMATWQWQLSGTRGGRVASAIFATVVVTCYTGVTMLVFLLQSGLDD
jgi:hypothetical protein